MLEGWGVASMWSFWTIWKKRNCRSFENVEQRDQALEILLLSSLLWTRKFVDEAFMSLFVLLIG